MTDVEKVTLPPGQDRVVDWTKQVERRGRVDEWSNGSWELGDSTGLCMVEWSNTRCVDDRLRCGMCEDVLLPSAGQVHYIDVVNDRWGIISTSSTTF